MTDKQKNFIINMDKAETHGDWLVLVQFGMPTLLKDQEVLLELIHREGQRQAERLKLEYAPVQQTKALLDELGLKIALV